MPTSSFRRTLLMALPLLLLLTACQVQMLQQQPDAGDTNPGLEQQPPAAQPAIPTDRCTGYDFETADPCDPGECTPDEYEIVPWSEASPGAPEFTWTYPCNPDGYRVTLYEMGLTQDDPFVELGSDEITDFDPSVGGPRRSWQPGVDLEPATAYAYALEPYRSSESPSGTSGSTHFWTGPFCLNVPTDAPTLTGPEDGHVITVTQAQTSGLGGFAWKYPDAPCLVTFEAEISSNAAFASSVLPIHTASPAQRYGGVFDALEWCRTYYWHVRATTDAGQGPWSETRSVRIEPTEGMSACFQLLPIDAVATENLSCRIGPGTIYGISTYLAAGERHPVEGRNADGSWVMLADLRCYVKRILVELHEDGTLLPPDADLGDRLALLTDPPTPAAPVTACKPTMNQPECLAAGGSWECVKVAGLPDSCKCDCP